MPEKGPLKRGPRLAEIPEFDPAMVTGLRLVGVTTLPEFLSSLHGDSEGMGKFLNITPEDQQRIWDVALNHLDPAEVDEIRSFVPLNRPLIPLSEEASKMVDAGRRRWATRFTTDSEFEV